LEQPGSERYSRINPGHDHNKKPNIQKKLFKRHSKNVRKGTLQGEDWPMSFFTQYGLKITRGCASPTSASPMPASLSSAAPVVMEHFFARSSWKGSFSNLVQSTQTASARTET
jgi:hypothetical protein